MARVPDSARERSRGTEVGGERPHGDLPHSCAHERQMWPPAGNLTKKRLPTPVARKSMIVPVMYVVACS